MIIALVLVILGFTSIIKPTYFSMPTDAPASALPKLEQNSLKSSGQPDTTSMLPNLDIFSGGALDDAINLSIHFFLMSFIGGFGYKIAMIGVNLIRPIVIKAGDKTHETILPS